VTVLIEDDDGHEMIVAISMMAIFWRNGIVDDKDHACAWVRAKTEC